MTVINHHDVWLPLPVCAAPLMCLHARSGSRRDVMRCKVQVRILDFEVVATVGGVFTDRCWHSSLNSY